MDHFKFWSLILEMYFCFLEPKTLTYFTEIGRADLKKKSEFVVSLFISYSIVLSYWGGGGIKQTPLDITKIFGIINLIKIGPPVL